MSRLGVVCCVVVGIDNKGGVNFFAKPTLKSSVVGFVYEASLICKFPCEIQLRMFGNPIIAIDHRETLNILLPKGVIRSAQQELPTWQFYIFLLSNTKVKPNPIVSTDYRRNNVMNS